MTEYTNPKTSVADIPWRELPQEEIDAILQERVDAFRARPSPKREGYVIERMALMTNLREADREAQSGNKVRRNRRIASHNRRAEQDLRALQMMILTMDFPPNNYRVSRRMSDCGKVRDIIIQDYFPWRILHHAIMRVIGEKVHKSLIYDSSACIKGKGLHFGARRMRMFLRRYETNYFWKADYKKFYQSIPHALILSELGRLYKDARFIRLMGTILSTYSSDIEDTLHEERSKRIANRGI
jgi:hypothetical protein